jgi:hypothetical protein
MEFLTVTKRKKISVEIVHFVMSRKFEGYIDRFPINTFLIDLQLQSSFEKRNNFF